MALSFTHLWKQQEHSDVDVILRTVKSSPHLDVVSNSSHLTTFPGHSVLLSNSQVFQAQILRWQDTQHAAKKRRAGLYGSSLIIVDQDNQDSRAQLVLELQDASEQQAAMAVLSSLYAVKPLPELLSELTQEQQLQVAVLADKWQVPNVSTAATQKLMQAMDSQVSGLSDSVKQRVMTAQALPDCLQPLLKRVLLSVLGDLEAVWADAELKQQLLGLSLPAMELLLSCDELKVATEDTVLYTVQQYLNKLGNCAQQLAAKQQLAPLVRCQHLSQFWLSTAAVSRQASTLALGSLRPSLTQLLLLRIAKPAIVREPSLITGDLLKLLPDAPTSWALGRRASTAVESVSMTCQLPVGELRAAALHCIAEQQPVKVPLPAVTTAPLGGIAFDMMFQCSAVEAGCKVGVYAMFANLPSDVYCSFKYEIVAAVTSVGSFCRPVNGSTGYGSPDFFGVGVMAGGWDEKAWTARGLPASGEVPIKLTVTEIAHMEAPAPAPAPAAVPTPAPAPARRAAGRRRAR